MSMAVGYASSASEQGTSDFSLRTESLVLDLKKQVETIGMTTEIGELLKEVENIKYKLEVKYTELSILEAMAMESTNENVVELREQLFTLVKLLYNDKIVEISESEFNNRKMLPTNGIGLSLNMATTRPDDNITRGNIFSRISTLFTKRKTHKNTTLMLNRGMGEDSI